MTTKRTPSKKAPAKPNRRPGKPAPKAPHPASAGKAGLRARPSSKASTAPAARTGSKQAELIAMLTRAHGATIADIVAATGWQAHTVRGAISGALRNRLGLTVTSENTEDRGRVYHIDS